MLIVWARNCGRRRRGDREGQREQTGFACADTRAREHVVGVVGDVAAPPERQHLAIYVPDHRRSDPAVAAACHRLVLHVLPDCVPDEARVAVLVPVAGAFAFDADLIGPAVGRNRGHEQAIRVICAAVAVADAVVVLAVTLRLPLGRWVRCAV